MEDDCKEGDVDNIVLKRMTVNNGTDKLWDSGDASLNDFTSRIYTTLSSAVESVKSLKNKLKKPSDKDNFDAKTGSIKQLPRDLDNDVCAVKMWAQNHTFFWSQATYGLRLRVEANSEPF